MRVRCLSFHADYRCGRSGVCCSSGWEIPVEAASERRIGEGLCSGRLRPPDAGETMEPAVPFDGCGADTPRSEARWGRPAEGLPHGARVVLRTGAAGPCVFLDTRQSRLCAVHRDLGEGALPSACRQFPRVVTLTPLGVSVALSHYCPTAASLIFESGVPRIVLDPPAFPRSWPFEGLDARAALPPLLRPGVLMSWPALERWENHAVATLADDSLAPEAALKRLAAAAEAAREWTPAAGDLDVFFADILARAASSPPAAEAPSAFDPGASPSAWDLVAAAVPDVRLRPPRPEVAVTPAARSLVDAGWSALGAPIRRWLASKAFASWVALQGDGLRTTVAGLRVALGVVRAEAARGCAEADRPLDAALLKEAIRRADLLLLHLADPQRLASGLGACERLPASRVLRSLPPRP